MKLYVNYNELDIPKAITMKDILNNKHLLTYDDFHFSDKSYQRFRTKEYSNQDEIDTFINSRKERYESLWNMFEAQFPNYDIEPTKTVEQFKIPKKSGGWRTITAPSGEYKELLTRLNGYLKNAFRCYSDQSYAYVPGRSIIDAVRRHKDSNWFVKIDLKDFFGSITTQSLYENMMDVYPFNKLEEVVASITLACTIDGVLPQGAPTSPILTNIFMTPIDHTIQKICDMKHQGVVYTRYADDLLFSAKTKEQLKDIIDDIEPTLNIHGLHINKEKTRQGSIAGRNWNLGLMLNKDHQITVGHVKAKQYKSMMYQLIKRFNEDDTTLQYDWREITGKLAWFNQIEPDYFDYLVTKYEKQLSTNYWNIIAVLSK